MIFPYHRSLTPMIGVLLGLAIIEMCVVHLVVVALLGWWAALGQQGRSICRWWPG